MYKIELPDKVKIPRIRLDEAHKILLEKYNKKSPIGNIDAEGEVLISKYVKEKYNCDFVFLTKYPVSKRPMYTMPDDEDKNLTKSFDLIFDGLEITTGGQRINDYKMLKENIEKFGLNPEDFDFYLETFKYGMPPHGRNRSLRPWAIPAMDCSLCAPWVEWGSSPAGQHSWHPVGSRFPHNRFRCHRHR